MEGGQEPSKTLLRLFNNKKIKFLNVRVENRQIPLILIECWRHSIVHNSTINSPRFHSSHLIKYISMQLLQNCCCSCCCRWQPHRCHNTIHENFYSNPMPMSRKGGEDKKWRMTHFICTFTPYVILDYWIKQLNWSTYLLHGRTLYEYEIAIRDMLICINVSVYCMLFLCSNSQPTHL